MFSIVLERKIKVQDFKSYPLQFPFKDASFLTRNTPAMLKEMSRMHEEDAHGDDLIAMETSNQIHTRAQLRAAESAANTHVLETDNLKNNANSPVDIRTDTPALPAANEARDNAMLLPKILPPRASGDDIVAARPFDAYDKDGIDIHANLADYSELEIAKALARHSVEIGLPKHYAPRHTSEGKMRVAGIKARKFTSKKAVLFVKFISPPSLKDVHIQLSAPTWNQTPSRGKVPT